MKKLTYFVFTLCFLASAMTIQGRPQIAKTLLGGSWNNPKALRSEDIIFKKNGTMAWRNGRDEGKSKWSVKGKNTLNFYGSDYKILSITNTKLVVSQKGSKTTYIRNTTKTNNPKPSFSIEGINDTKGEYKNKKQSWTIHFSDKKQNFIAFHTLKNKGKRVESKVLIVDHIQKISNQVFKIHMKGISGEIVPTWTLIYNTKKKFYDLHTHSYNATSDKWFDSVYKGSKDNG